MIWAALAALLWASVAQATPIFISGCDGADNQTTTAVDSFEFTEFTAGSGVADADIRVQAVTAHNTASGGSDSSKMAVRAEATSSSRHVYYRLTNNFTPTFPSLTMGASVYVASPPATRRTILSVLEDAGNPDPGCSVVLNSNRTLDLAYLGTGDALGTCAVDADCDPDERCYDGANCRKYWGTTTQKLEQLACDTDPTVPCTTDIQCPQGGNCGGLTDNVLYWAGIEVPQTFRPGSVICELYINGRGIFTAASKNLTTVSNGQNIAFGLPNIGTDDTPSSQCTGSGAPWGCCNGMGTGTCTNTATVFFDDIVVDDGSQRAGFGYVGRLVPSATGTPGSSAAWVATNCSRSLAGIPYLCLNDYNVSGFFYDAGVFSDNVIRANGPGKQHDFPILSGPIVLNGVNGESVKAVSPLVVGLKAATNGNRQLSVAVLSCANGGNCQVAATAPTVLFGTVADPAGARVLLTTPFVSTTPNLPQGEWGPYLSQLGIRVSSAATTGSLTTYIGALALYVQVVKPDQKEPPTLQDRNGDGRITIANIGDSTLHGTEESSCTNDPDKPCSQDSYCSWDSSVDCPTCFQDLPPGGCMSGTPTPDRSCQRCSGNVAVGCSGIDLVATPGAACNFGTCSCTVTNCGGFCSEDASIICDEDADCTTNLGTCTPATCVESCPGGDCPEDRVGWDANMAQKVSANTILSCGYGGETSDQMYNRRFLSILAGKMTGGQGVGNACEAAVGSGRCTCNGNEDCGSGTCSSGFCIGDPVTAVCTKGEQCNLTAGACGATACWCQGDVPDVLNVLIGYNDLLTALPHDPNCTGAYQFGGNGFTGCPATATTPTGYQGPRVPCSLDSECASVGTGSRCFGVTTDTFTNGPGQNCSAKTSPRDCTINTSSCEMGNQCLNGQTCSEVNPIAPGATENGICLCTQDSQCPTNFHCVGTPGNRVCRWRGGTGSDCSTNANCGTGGLCDTSTCDASPGDGRCDGDVNFCKGRCTAPCDSVACASDAGCGSTNQTHPGGFPVPPVGGMCNPATGKCANCGPFTCFDHEALLQNGCSCASGTDCPGGACTNGVCTGAAARANCFRDSECAAGQRCMRANRRITLSQDRYSHLYRDVVKKMQDYLDSLGPTAPILIASAIPMPNGQVKSGANILTNDDRACMGSSKSGRLWGPARFYYQKSYADLLTVLPPHHVVDQSAFNNRRMAEPLHRDQVHFLAAGAEPIEDAIVDTLNLSNVCVQADLKTPQLYCRLPSGTYETTACDGDVAACSTMDASCVRKACNGMDAACPNVDVTGVTCGPP